MTPWTKVWLREMGLTGHEAFIPCELCRGQAVVDIHHINGRIGPLRTDINNLIGVCRQCHARCHAGIITKEQQHEAVQRRTR